jgi:hypothetical protein
MPLFFSARDKLEMEPFREKRGRRERGRIRDEIRARQIDIETERGERD